MVDQYDVKTGGAEATADAKEEATLDTANGLDARFDARFKQRIETLKRAVRPVIMLAFLALLTLQCTLTPQNLKDIHLSITPRDAMGGVVMSRRPGGLGEEEERQLPQKIRQPLESESGQIGYYTGHLLGGTIEVCVQSYTATVEMPSRVSLDIHELDDSKAVDEELAEKRRALTKEQVEAENKLVKEETSRITSELMRMHRRAKSVGGDARYSKDREEAFHNLSVSLNKAVRYWPLFRMAVLLVGGYLQVTHVVSFMKSRHIY
jgi:hypothetical protein